VIEALRFGETAFFVRWVFGIWNVLRPAVNVYLELELESLAWSKIKSSLRGCLEFSCGSLNEDP
jgi:hypothetical protein